jgi:hypothetical protein
MRLATVIRTLSSIRERLATVCPAPMSWERPYGRRLRIVLRQSSKSEAFCWPLLPDSPTLAYGKA